MVDLFFVLGFCSVSLFCLDQLGLWEVILKHLGTDLFVHHFWATYIIINAIFYSFALFLAYFDLKNTSTQVTSKLSFIGIDKTILRVIMLQTKIAKNT